MSRPVHQWDTSTRKNMVIEDVDDSKQSRAAVQILDYREAERYVEELQKFDIKEVGSKLWMQQHIR